MNQNQNQNYTLIAFIKWLASSYTNLEKQAFPYTCKLVGFFEKKGKLYAQIELSGQLETYDTLLEKLISDNKFEYFSPNDKKRLFKAFYQDERFVLSDQYYCQEKQQEMVVLKDKTTGNQMQLPAQDVLSNSGLMNKLNKNDIKSISWASAADFYKGVIDKIVSVHEK